MNSYIQVSAVLVLSRAKLTLEWLTQLRAKTWDSRIVEEQARRGRARFWMPWLKPLSVHQAQQRIVEEGRSCTGRHTPDYFMYAKQERCDALIKLAQTAIIDAGMARVGFMYLSYEDLEHITLPSCAA